MKKNIISVFFTISLLFAQNTFADAITDQMKKDKKFEQYLACNSVADIIFDETAIENSEKRLDLDFPQYAEANEDDAVNAIFMIQRRIFKNFHTKAGGNKSEFNKIIHDTYKSPFCQSLYK